MYLISKDRKVRTATDCALDDRIFLHTKKKTHTTTPHSLPQQHGDADIASNCAQLTEEPITTLKAFLEDFKGLFAHLIHQNSLILKMLTILNKHH